MAPVRPDPLDELRRFLAPDAVDALLDLVRTEVEDALTRDRAARDGDTSDLLTVEQAAAVLSCTPAALRMRLTRGPAAQSVLRRLYQLIRSDCSTSEKPPAL